MHAIDWDVSILKPCNQSNMTGNETPVFSKRIGPMAYHAFRDSFGRYRIIGTINNETIAAVISFPCKGRKAERQKYNTATQSRNTEGIVQRNY